MIWLDCGSQGRRGKLEGGAAEVRPVLELMASHGKNPTSLALSCRLQSASSEAGLPGSSVQNTSTHDLPLSDCHKGAVIQGLPRPSESHTCSPPSAEASAWSQLPCPSRAQQVHSLSPSTGPTSVPLHRKPQPGPGFHPAASLQLELLAGGALSPILPSHSDGRACLIPGNLSEGLACTNLTCH